MDKYKKLLSNTVIFAIGTFSSKILVFLLMPFYTWALTTDEYGTADLITQTGNLLLPLITLGIVNGIIRFGLDKSVRKDDVLSTGIIITLGGFLVMLLFAPLLMQISVISGYTWLVYLFVLSSSMRSIFSQFVRVKGLVRLYAVDGIMSTFMTILFNLLFLLVFHLGVVGYVLATICADLVSSIFLFFTAKLKKYIKFQGISKKTAVEMLKYSIPLISNMLCWWVTNSSDKFIVAYMLGNGKNGILTAAYKIPTIIVLISNIFLDAWQMSAVMEEKGRAAFFTKVFKNYSALVFMAGSGIILTARPLMWLMTIVAKDEAYQTAWMFIPFLAMATVFSCLVTFIGSVYTVEKKSVLSMATMLAGAGVNIILNFILIPYWGVNGAAFATFIGYLLVFILRGQNVRRYIKMKLSAGKIILNTLVLFAQSLIVINEIPYWVLYEIGLCLFMLLINGKDLLASIRKFLYRQKMA